MEPANFFHYFENFSIIVFFEWVFLFYYTFNFCNFFFQILELFPSYTYFNFILNAVYCLNPRNTNNLQINFITCCVRRLRTPCKLDENILIFDNENFVEKILNQSNRPNSVELLMNTADVGSKQSFWWRVRLNFTYVTALSITVVDNAAFDSVD